MLDVEAARTGLAAILEELAPAGAKVLPAGIEALAVFPAVIVGMPIWSGDGPNYQFTTWTWPIAVVVNRTGSDKQTIGLLDKTWPVILAGLRAVSGQDGSLGGICVEAVVTRAQFGTYQIQGVTYPAQVIFLDLYA